MLKAELLPSRDGVCRMQPDRDAGRKLKLMLVPAKRKPASASTVAGFSHPLQRPVLLDQGG